MTTNTDIQGVKKSDVQSRQARRPLEYRPCVDIMEKDDELVLVADVPGARAEDIDLQFENGLLTLDARVSARQPGEAGEFLIREYGVGGFRQSFWVGEGIDATQVRAELSNGLLTLHLPKSEAARPRQIAVKNV